VWMQCSSPLEPWCKSQDLLAPIMPGIDLRRGTPQKRICNVEYAKGILEIFFVFEIVAELTAARY
jgi:hypothetical protein